jgi:hypothetical protein
MKQGSNKPATWWLLPNGTACGKPFKLPTNGALQPRLPAQATGTLKDLYKKQLDPAAEWRNLACHYFVLPAGRLKDFCGLDFRSIFPL